MRPVTIATTVQKRPAQTTPPLARPSLWMHLEDKDISNSSWGGGLRPCAPCPAVWPLKDDPHAIMNEQWQYFLRAINYNMEVDNVYLLLDNHLAFANESGFRSEADPRADWFHRKDLDRDPPNLDKVRTCSRSVLTGTPVYSLVQAMKQALAVVEEAIMRRILDMSVHLSFRAALATQNVLKVTTFDSRQPPPLKPGRSYPSRVEDTNPDDYLYTPRTHPWMFLVATIVNRAGECVQFPRGGLYSWTGDNTPRSFVPHISNHAYGDVTYPLARLRAVAPTDPLPSPYRSTPPGVKDATQ